MSEINAKNIALLIDADNVDPNGINAVLTVLAELAGTDVDLDTIHQRLCQRDPRFVGLSLIAPEGEGQRVKGGGTPPPAKSGDFVTAFPDGTLPLLVVDTLFGSERLASLSGPLASVRAEPQLLVHPALARQLGLADGEPVRVRTASESFALTLKTCPGMAEGLAVTPRLYGTRSERFTPGVCLPCRIERGDAP